MTLSRLCSVNLIFVKQSQLDWCEFGNCCSNVGVPAFTNDCFV